MTDRRTPTTDTVFVVRYVRVGNRDDVRHRYFSRHHDAATYADKLRDWGREARIYRSSADWVEVES